MKKLLLIIGIFVIMSIFASAQSYIVEFNEKSSLEKYNELNNKNQIYINKDNSMFFLNPIRLYYWLFLIKSDRQIQKEVDKYNLELDMAFEVHISELKEQYNLDDSKIGTKFTKGFPGVVIYTDQATSEKIKEKPYVRSVTPNLALSTMADDTFSLMDIDKAWLLKDAGNNNLKGQGVRIAVVDTGFDLTKPAFNGINVVEKQCFCNQDDAGCCPDGKKDMKGDAALTDNNGHGTAMLGILASKHDKYKGIAPNAEYLLLKISDQTQTSTTEDVLKALQFVIDPNNDGNFNDRADVLSLSLGAIAKELYDKVIEQYQSYGLSNEEIKQAVMDYFEPMNRIIAESSELGITVIAAAGNNPNEGYITAFAMVEEPIIVGALTKENTLAKYSSLGPAFNGLDAPDVLATGGCTFNCIDFSYYGSLDPDGQIAYLKENVKKGIRTARSSSVVCMVKTQNQECLDNGIIFGKENEEIYTIENKNFVSLEGTSLSAAVVSGISALILQKHPEWTPSMVQQALKMSATSLGLDKYKQGAGKVNTIGAINADFTCLGIDLNTDEMNCGRCGNKCTNTYQCKQGVCEFCGDNVCNGNENHQSCGQDCQECTPQCNGKQCGTDNCGGTCGTCSGAAACTMGKCIVTLKGIRVKCTNGVCEDYVLDELPLICSGEYNANTKIYKTGYSDAGGELVNGLENGKFTLPITG